MSGRSAPLPQSPPTAHRGPRADDRRSASGTEWRWKRYPVPEPAADRSREPRERRGPEVDGWASRTQYVAQQLNPRRVDLIWVAEAVGCCEVDHALNPRAQHGSNGANRQRLNVWSCPCRWRPAPAPRRYGRVAGRARPACRSWGKRDWRTLAPTGGRFGQGILYQPAVCRDVSEASWRLARTSRGPLPTLAPLPPASAALAASGSVPSRRSARASSASWLSASARLIAGYAPKPISRARPANLYRRTKLRRGVPSLPTLT